MNRRRIRGQSGDGPCEELVQILKAAVNVSTDVIGIVRLQRGRRHDIPSDDDVPEAWSETLDLSLYARRHIKSGAVGDVAVAPCRLPSLWSAARIPLALLS